jgi:hypothetical protein
MKDEVKLAIKALLRLNRLRLKKKLNKVTWQQFFLYKRIVKNNARREELDKEVTDILDH